MRRQLISIRADANVKSTGAIGHLSASGRRIADANAYRPGAGTVPLVNDLLGNDCVGLDPGVLPQDIDANKSERYRGKDQIVGDDVLGTVRYNAYSRIGSRVWITGQDVAFRMNV